VDEIDHLTGGDVVVAEGWVFGSVTAEVLVESVGGFAEQRSIVSGDAAVGVEFDEDPRGSVLNEGAELSPESETFERGWIGAGEIGIFNAGDKPELTALPIETEWPLDQKKMLWACGEVCGDTGRHG
jgi:hypothetical protein